MTLFLSWWHEVMSRYTVYIITWINTWQIVKFLTPDQVLKEFSVAERKTETVGCIIETQNLSKFSNKKNWYAHQIQSMNLLLASQKCHMANITVTNIKYQLFISSLNLLSYLDHIFWPYKAVNNDTVPAKKTNSKDFMLFEFLQIE